MTDPRLHDRITRAAAAQLAETDTLSVVEVFLRIGWLDPFNLKRWRTGQADSFEGVMQSPPARLREGVRLLAEWAQAQGLTHTEGAWLTPTMMDLRFTRGGPEDVEALYRRHYLRPTASPKARAKLEAKVQKAPERTVFFPRDAWTCARCGGTGELLTMEPAGPVCLPCAGLGAHEFLAAGDAKLTRRAKAASATYAVVLRWSRTRKQYERQGLLVEREALRRAREPVG